ncbi:hypothetical protein CRG98_028078 [Punica granatum]|uniref:PsbP C-terminal domain-containing protein n=1 Tax=Punica granatum TaxID=22663 RepID=A0A2I0J5L2_PUNGR|nr:hypothetical protein CRG98_028078 [Punica granatum]
MRFLHMSVVLHSQKALVHQNVHRSSESSLHLICIDVHGSHHNWLRIVKELWRYCRYDHALQHKDSFNEHAALLDLISKVKGVAAAENCTLKVDTKKLGKISIHVYTKDDAREPIPSVLLLLSGDDGYRNNSVSSAGGEFLFDNLFPGSFNLHPLLKEYAFSPATQAAELGSGESREIGFQATPVASSRKKLVRSQKATLRRHTDSAESFNLRGLFPDTAHAIRLVSKDGLRSSKTERASPAIICYRHVCAISIHLPEEDSSQGRVGFTRHPWSELCWSRELPPRTRSGERQQSEAGRAVSYLSKGTVTTTSRQSILRTIIESSRRPDGKGSLIESNLREHPSTNVRYYELEFKTKSPMFHRHNVAVCCAQSGKLFTLNAQSPEPTWPSVQADFSTMAGSVLNLQEK